MESNPIRFEKREEGFGAVFLIETEEFRECSEEEARGHYNVLIDKRANALIEMDSLEEQIEKYDIELQVFGDIFETEIIAEETLEESDEEVE